jgi:histidinol phosphatase-like PHP family hydrolase
MPGDVGGGVRRLLGTQDLHVHTTMSDGDLTLAEVVAVARERGVQIGIADHVSSRNARLFVADQTRLDRYLAVLDDAPVLRSAEFCWCDPFAAGLARDLLDRFDYLIGSNHGFALPDGSFASPWWTSLPESWRDRPQELMEIMVRNLCDMVAAMPIQIVAHSTLMPAVLLSLDPDVHVWWTEDREERFIAAAVREGVAIEISNRYRLPHRRFLERARSMGASFTLGSDGHHREQIAQLGWAVRAAEAVGIDDAQLFVPSRRDGRST